MYATERRSHITRLVVTQGRVGVAELADELGVTSETIRRDLDQLEGDGAVRRVHGGAITPDRGSTTEPSFADRVARRPEAKTAIGAAAAGLVPVDFTGSVLIDAGSTTERLAAVLAELPAERAARLTVVTNAVPVAVRLSANPALPVVLLGGRVRGLTAAAVGPTTIEQLGDLRVDLAFVGTNGLSATFGLSTPDPDEAAVKRAMVRSARRTIVLADADKFEAEALTRFAGLDEVDALVSDAAPPVALAEALAAADVEVVRA